MLRRHMSALLAAVGGLIHRPETKSHEEANRLDDLRPHPRKPRRSSGRSRWRSRETPGPRVERQRKLRAIGRRFLRSRQRVDELRGQINLGKLEPVHPRDHHWYAVGLIGGRFKLDPPTHGGGSYFARYRAMYEAGWAKRGGL